MRLASFTFFVFICVVQRDSNANRIASRISKRIIGGEPVEYGNSPFLVSLQDFDLIKRTGKHICGASVIFNEYLLTAAHCVTYFADKPENLKAFIGTQRSGTVNEHTNHSHLEDTSSYRESAQAIIQAVLEGRAVDTNRQDSVKRDDEVSDERNAMQVQVEYESCIEKIVIHEGYNRTTLANDIAILKLAMPIPEKYQMNVVPVSLPTAAMEKQGYPVAGSICTVFGWGLAHATISASEWSEEDVESQAKKVDVEVRNYTICERLNRFYHSKNITYDDSKYFCAGNLGTNEHGGAFRGDSGGPLICAYAGNYYQAGIVSFGTYTLGAYLPAFFTRVTTYEDWIKSVIAQD